MGEGVQVREVKRLRSYLDDKSLKGKIGVAMLVSLSISFLAFWLMNTLTIEFINRYFDDEKHWKALTDVKADELQNYVTANNISTDDWEALRSWDKKNRGVYIYIYDKAHTIYESSTNFVSYSYENYEPITFSDKTADMSIFYAIDYAYYMFSVLVDGAISVIIFFVIMMGVINNVIKRIKNLENDVKILEGGSLDHEIHVTSNDEIGSLGQSLNDMRIAFRNNLEEGEELTRANSDLVARMAHDLRTPLTSLLLYLDLLSDRKYTNEKDFDNYIKISRDKAERIKYMTDQLFERSLITGEKTEPLDEPSPAKYVLEDALSVFIMTLETEGVTTISEINWPDIKVSVSLNYIERILDNIYSNILKYADRNKPIQVKVYEGRQDSTKPDTTDNRTVVLEIANYIGNRAVSAGGSNIGLENIDMMLERMGVSFKTEEEGDIFRMILNLPEAAD